MHDPFEGTWKLNPVKSQFDANHQPREGTMRLQVGTDGSILLTAEGRNNKGEPFAERPQKLIPDGQPRPIPEMPGLTSVATRPDRNTIRGQALREDGSVAGEGTYVVSDDGRFLMATTAGFDSQLRRFELRTVWDRL